MFVSSQSDLNFPFPPNDNDNDEPLIVDKNLVIMRIWNFPKDSSRGIDGFRLQFLKDLTSLTNRESGNRLLSDIPELHLSILRSPVYEADVSNFVETKVTNLNY